VQCLTGSNSSDCVVWLEQVCYDTDTAVCLIVGESR